MGTMEVHTSTDFTTWEVVWTKSGNQGDVWHEAIVDIDPNIKRLRFAGETFAGSEAKAVMGDMAVDDISIDVVDRPTDPPSPEPSYVGGRVHGAVDRPPRTSAHPLTDLSTLPPTGGRASMPPRPPPDDRRACPLHHLPPLDAPPFPQLLPTAVLVRAVGVDGVGV